MPKVGTLQTIFEDLPYPVNEPYDDGRDSNIDEYFELPSLEVKKSESSSSALPSVSPVFFFHILYYFAYVVRYNRKVHL